MRRLQPLPERGAAAKKQSGPTTPPPRAIEVSDGGAESIDIDMSRSAVILSLDLTRMKSEIASLEKEELVHHQSQLQVAQERLRTKRRSDLAKRMQESQRLQTLRERKAELEETRRSKVVDFKQKMIAAAERSLEKESMLYDVLYDNIGEAMATDADFPFSDGNDSVVIEDDMSAVMGGNFGDAVSPDVRQPQTNKAPSMDFSFEQFRVPTAFEEHLKFEQKEFASQLQALRQVHSAPKPVVAAYATKKEAGLLLPPLLSSRFGGGARGARSGNPTLAPTLLPYLSGLPMSARRTEDPSPRGGPTSGGDVDQKSPHDGVNLARMEHARVRDELKRLIAQSSDADEHHALAAVPPLPQGGQIAQTDVVSTTKNVVAVWVTPTNLDLIVQEKLEALEKREAEHTSREAVIAASAVPFEDTLRKGNTVILEDAEANFRSRFALEKSERERIERQERFQNRTASMFGGTLMSEADASPKTRSKTRRVSMLLDGESAEATTTSVDLKSPPLGDVAPLLESIPSVSETFTPTFPPQRATPAAAASDNSSGHHGVTAAANRRKDSLPTALAIMTNAEDRQQMIYEQQHARFMAKRSVQKEELSSIKRKLLELMRQDEMAEEELKVRQQQQQQQQASAQFLPDVEASAVGVSVSQRVSSNVSPSATPLRSVSPSQAAFSTNCDDDDLEEEDDPVLNSASAAMAAMEQEKERAAVMIQSTVRCMIARRVFVETKAGYEAAAARMALIVLEEEQQMMAERQELLVQLATERDHLQSLLQREALLDEAAELRALEIREAALLAAAAQIKNDARRGRAAEQIQRIVRGSQTRTWYRAVLVARSALTAAAFTRSTLLIQSWWRSIAKRRVAQKRSALRRRLLQRHALPASFIPMHVGAIATAATSCIQRLMRRCLTLKTCARRRSLAQKELRQDLQWDAAIVIQRQWRKYSLHRHATREMVYHAVDNAALTASVLESSLVEPEEQSVTIVRVTRAATVIAKYTKRYLLRDEWRQRWLKRLLFEALQATESIRQERRMLGHDDDGDCD
ncbi:IQ calmodulin-binding protein, putative [Bodo saltans]|uniref:IQ calmodulin-binding protein, putative n=1 Tax=Bodo saltans TaxID=75058 RepID=A0A0S4J5Z4_BODSA|nr:IQ calmodulin-binding protein, putative [Bodo saltans]|eukprot:CUG84111.1 IQ calmodulin-binding protein, putative [Bodo saltans]